MLLTVLARVCAANDRYRFRCTCYGERIGVAYRLLVWLLEYETNKVQSASSRKEIIICNNNENSYVAFQLIKLILPNSTNWPSEVGDIVGYVKCYSTSSASGNSRCGLPKRVVHSNRATAGIDSVL